MAKATKRKTGKKRSKPPAGDYAATAAAPLEAAAQAATLPDEPGNNRDYTFVDLTASICPFCRSTNRERYHHTEIIKGPVSIRRVSYSRVELRRTKCSDCGRRRIDRSLVPMDDPRVPMDDPHEDSPQPGK